MFRQSLIGLAVLMLFPMLADSSGSSGNQAHSARHYMPGYRVYLTHHHCWHRVDYRVDAWMNVPATDQNTANQIAKHFRSYGWTTQTVQTGKGVYVVKAKMYRWRLATYSAHWRTAEAVAGLLRSQGYQARVVY